MERKMNNLGGNNQLRGKYWECPDYVLNCLDTAVKRYDSTNKNGKPTEGYKRAKGIISDNKIEYNHMKRIKNWFDNYDGEHNDMEYRLNGGKTMHNWVDSTLNRETAAIKGPKKIKMETGMANQFLKNHEKKNTKINHQSLKAKIPQLSKDIKGQVWRGKPVYEEIKKIKSLIIYESKI